MFCLFRIKWLTSILFVINAIDAFDGSIRQPQLLFVLINDNAIEIRRPVKVRLE